jgi:hypothetical protein
MPADEHFDDIGPDLDLEVDDNVQIAADSRLSLVVPFTSERLSALSTYARGQGINAIEAVQRLVDEALAARAKH